MKPAQKETNIGRGIIRTVVALLFVTFATTSATDVDSISGNQTQQPFVQASITKSINVFPIYDKDTAVCMPMANFRNVTAIVKDYNLLRKQNTALQDIDELCKSRTEVTNEIQRNCTTIDDNRVANIKDIQAQANTTKYKWFAAGAGAGFLTGIIATLSVIIALN